MCENTSSRVSPLHFLARRCAIARLVRLGSRVIGPLSPPFSASYTASAACSRSGHWKSPRSGRAPTKRGSPCFQRSLTSCQRAAAAPRDPGSTKTLPGGARLEGVDAALTPSRCLRVVLDAGQANLFERRQNETLLTKVATSRYRDCPLAGCASARSGSPSDHRQSGNSRTGIVARGCGCSESLATRRSPA